MAKGNSKSKPLKFQTYRVPKNHYFFVLQNPWPFGTSPTSNSQSFFNAVAAWLSFMIHDLCDLDISTTQLVIYWQSTHRDLIADIEIPLPASGEDLAVILSQILGAHRSSQFLIPEYAGHGDHTIVVWEYNLERQNHPDKTNWNAASATYTSLPDNFPVKRGDPLIPTRQMYPPPGVPKNVTQLKWCKPLPTRLREGHPDCVPIPLQPAPPPTTLPQPSAHAPALVPPSANHNDKNFLANANTASSSRSKGHPPGAEPSALRSGSPATGEQPPQSEASACRYSLPRFLIFR
ncbi:hypothetical protein B0H10DRAFT_507151 [Mycena sp. CBHHK59/15]|nr:hypothetical protein B0H10DRAFT_507151 [Mycena sp. CBHHK59/15]